MNILHTMIIIRDIQKLKIVLKFSKQDIFLSNPSLEKQLQASS